MVGVGGDGEGVGVGEPGVGEDDVGRGGRGMYEVVLDMRTRRKPSVMSRAPRASAALWE